MTHEERQFWNAVGCLNLQVEPPIVRDITELATAAFSAACAAAVAEERAQHEATNAAAVSQLAHASRMHAEAVRAERAAWIRAVEAATGPTGGWLIGPAELLRARSGA